MTKWAMLVVSAALIAGCTTDPDPDSATDSTVDGSAIEVDGSAEPDQQAGTETTAVPTTVTDRSVGTPEAARPGPTQIPDDDGPIELWLGRGEMTDESITLHWALDERVDAVGYALHRLEFDPAVDPMSIPLDTSTEIHRAAASSTGTVDDGVERLARYWYVLLAVDDTGTEHRRATDAHAVTDVEPPTPVTGLTAVAADGAITVQWDRSEDNHQFGRYNIRRSVDGADSIYYGTGWSAEQTTFIDDRPPPPGSSVRYEVSAVDFHSNSTDAAVVEVTAG